MYIYLVKEEYGLTKIGCSSDIKQRLTSLRSCSPYEMELLHYKRILTANEIERALHESFKDKRKKGEWFDLDDKDIEKIHSLLDYDEELIPTNEEPKEILSETPSEGVPMPPPLVDIPLISGDKITSVQKVAIEGLLEMRGLDWVTIYRGATGKESTPSVEELSYQEAVTVIKYCNDIDKK